MLRIKDRKKEIHLELFESNDEEILDLG